MFHFLTTIYSWPFALGAIVGMLGHRAYCLAQARHEDRCHPLPDGQRHVVGGMSRVWIGGLVSVMVLGYVLLQAEQTHRDTVHLSEATRRCTGDLIKSIARGREISAQNDDLSVKQRALLAEINDATGMWINRLLNLPEPIANLEPDDPRRQQYGLDVTRVYFERTSKLRGEVDANAEEQRKLAAERSANELPDPRCGG